MDLQRRVPRPDLTHSRVTRDFVGIGPEHPRQEATTREQRLPPRCWPDTRPVSDVAGKCRPTVLPDVGTESPGERSATHDTGKGEPRALSTGDYQLDGCDITTESPPGTKIEHCEWLAFDVRDSYSVRDIHWSGNVRRRIDATRPLRTTNRGYRDPPGESQ